MSEPARKIKRSAVKNIVRFPAIKANNGKSILVESILESKYCLHLEFNNQVASYSPQPTTLMIPGDDRNNKYTPDFLVNLVSGDSFYVEVKPREYLDLPEYRDLFERVSLMLKGTKWGFQSVDETDIYVEPLLGNYEMLYRYRVRPDLDKSHMYDCASDIGDAPIRLRDLIDLVSKKATLREVYSWLALGYLTFNWNRERISLNTEVSFNVS